MGNTQEIEVEARWIGRLRKRDKALLEKIRLLFIEEIGRRTPFPYVQTLKGGVAAEDSWFVEHFTSAERERLGVRVGEIVDRCLVPFLTSTYPSPGLLNFNKFAWGAFRIEMTSIEDTHTYYTLKFIYQWTLSLKEKGSS